MTFCVNGHYFFFFFLNKMQKMQMFNDFLFLYIIEFQEAIRNHQVIVSSRKKISSQLSSE